MGGSRAAQAGARGPTCRTRATPEPGKPETGKTIADAVDLFILDKKAQGVTANVVYKYTSELGRFQTFCDANRVLTPGGISRELLTRYAATWENIYPSSITRGKVRERLRSFLRYCVEASGSRKSHSFRKSLLRTPKHNHSRRKSMRGSWMPHTWRMGSKPSCTPSFSV